MTRPWLRLGLLASVLLVCSATNVGAQAASDGFPHTQHAGLFPLCTGCHVMDGPRASFYPAAQSCNGCHDGVEERRVSWAPPPELPSLLQFSHPEHEREAADDNISCEGCHVQPTAGRMEVVDRAVVETCLSCHAHAAQEHLVDARCSTCHVPLAESRFGADRIVSLPTPRSHAADDFIMAHAGGAECAVCHTRERCETCHVNAAMLSDIQAIPAAPAAMELPRWAAYYPTPANHFGRQWLERHGAVAQDPASCATCHAREDCTTCHLETQPAPVLQLPSRGRVQAPGVGVERSAPPSHDFPEFATAHAAEASTAATSCTACHGRTECRACHDSPAPAAAMTQQRSEPRSEAGPAGFHPVNFAVGHAEAAWARRLECSNCHEPEVFCASCHRSSGLAAQGIQGAIYHDAQAVWLLRHGQAARQGLESCVSCHRQQDCLRCHSQLGSFRVSPHGPGFDPERARSRNAFVCRACHLSDPGRGGS